MKVRLVRVMVTASSGFASGTVQLTAAPFKERVTVEHEPAQPRLDVARMTTSAATKVSGCSNFDASRRIGEGEVRK